MGRYLKTHKANNFMQCGCKGDQCTTQDADACQHRLSEKWSVHLCRLRLAVGFGRIRDRIIASSGAAVIDVESFVEDDSSAVQCVCFGAYDESMKIFPSLSENFHKVFLQLALAQGQKVHARFPHSDSWLKNNWCRQMSNDFAQFE